MAVLLQCVSATCRHQLSIDRTNCRHAALGTSCTLEDIAWHCYGWYACKGNFYCSHCTVGTTWESKARNRGSEFRVCCEECRLHSNTRGSHQPNLAVFGRQHNMQFDAPPPPPPIPPGLSTHQSTAPNVLNGHAIVPSVLDGNAVQHLKCDLSEAITFLHHVMRRLDDLQQHMNDEFAVIEQSPAPFI